MLRAAMLAAAAVALSAPPAVSPDVLEPSIRNEVDHALDMAPTNAVAVAAVVSPAAPQSGTNAVACVVADVFGTNGLSRTEIALKLVSSQKSDGRWLSGTNDVTSAAIEILRSLL